jgi:hypothetical protein
LAASATQEVRRRAFFPAKGNAWQCGRSILQLASAIAKDLEMGHLVSLGFEAPMWFPVRRSHSANLKLFAPRFRAERGSEWYLQSGAAATLKAISAGTMLLSLIQADSPRVRLTTAPDSIAPGTIGLFEAFVVDDFKVTPPPQVARQAPNEWDAFTASLAWGAFYRAFDVPDLLAPRRLHTAGTEPSELISIWKTIVSNVPQFPQIEGPPDCDVIALSAISTGSESAG